MVEENLNLDLDMANDEINSDISVTPLQALTFPLFGRRLIEASAGTGKTYTIASLFIRLLLGHGKQGDAPLDGDNTNAIQSAEQTKQSAMQSTSQASSQTAHYSALTVDKILVVKHV